MRRGIRRFAPILNADVRPEKMKMKTKWAFGLAICVAIVAVAAAWRADTPYREWDSRDGSLRIVVKKQWIASFIPAMPGQGGDAPGWVTVIDKRTGATLLRKSVPMVNVAEDEIGEFRGR